MRTMLEWYEWMLSDSLAQIEQLAAEDRLVARLLEDREAFEGSGERIESLRRHAFRTWSAPDAEASYRRAMCALHVGGTLPTQTEVFQGS